MTSAPVGNPLREGLTVQRVPQPFTFVIFGATGDLTGRKLLPALYDLYRERLLPASFAIVGVARRDIGDEGFRERSRDAVAEFSRARPIEPTVWESFAPHLHYVRANFDAPEGYRALCEEVSRLDSDEGTGGNRLHYLATQPTAYEQVVRRLGEAGLAQPGEGRWTRIIIEKPFGWDLASARELNRTVAEVFAEEQVYRIDHYLGKETVQNILVFRFANGIFEPIWNRRYMDNVQISVAESVGVEGRGAYYEESGALRDMVQNHLMQLLAVVAMEPPASFDAESVRDEKMKVFHSLVPVAGDDVTRHTVRAQYKAGAVGGQAVPGYRQEPEVDPKSVVETYVALRLFIENWRWAGVPFYLRVGKRLPKRVTEIAVQFKQAPLRLFPGPTGDFEPNILTLRIQPDEGIALSFGAKLPGQSMRVRTVHMDFHYGASFGIDPMEAYERLILDALLGDATLFNRWDAVEQTWEAITPILDQWANGKQPELAMYEAGSWGPHESDELLEQDGRRWRRL